MKKLVVLALTALLVAGLIAGCGSTAKETGSQGSYYNNPTSYK